MFLPIGDAPNPIGFKPWVNWSLIGTNVAVYLVTLFFTFGNPEAAQSLVIEHGYRPGAPQLTDLFTSMFMHAGLLHLAGNMLFLWIYGDNVEHHLGRVTYLIVYLATGAAATLTFAFFAGDSMVPLVGASGAISGVLGLYFLLFPRNVVKVFVFFFPFVMTTLMIPARVVLGIYVVVENFFPALVGSGSNVAYGAHLGGFFAGLGLAFVGERVGWLRGRSARRPKQKAPAATIKDTETALSRAVRVGDRQAALRIADSLHPAQVIDALGPATVELAQWWADEGSPAMAMKLLRHALSSRDRNIDQARVYLTLAKIRLAEGRTTSAYQHLMAALDHDPDEATELELRAALSTLRSTGN